MVLAVRPHEFFEREGNDLHCVIPISFPQAALGAEIEIDALDGPVKLKIPEGTQSGRELRVRGRGVPILNEQGQRRPDRQSDRRDSQEAHRASSAT